MRKINRRVSIVQTNTLVCAATWMELRAYDPTIDESIGKIGYGRRPDAVYLVTGVGIPRALERVLQVAGRERPDSILNLGIAGAYPNSGLNIGDIVVGESEVYGDLGFELFEPPGFQPLREAPFGLEYREPFLLSVRPQWAATANGRGCTVNMCAGTLATGLLREHLFSAAFETMEGAAVAQAGQSLTIPVSEVRAISNIAAERDMRPENIQAALANLTQFFAQSGENYRA